MTTTILIIVNVFAALSIIVLALMQQSKGDMGSAFGGGGSQSMFGSRGSANFLSRLTATMCAAFFISSLALAYVYAQRAESSSVVESQSAVESSTLESEVPTIEGEALNVESSNEIPSIEGIQESAENIQQAVESTVDAVQETASDAIDTLEAQAPVVPENNN